MAMYTFSESWDVKASIGVSQVKFYAPSFAQLPNMAKSVNNFSKLDYSLMHTLMWMKFGKCVHNDMI